MILLMIMMMMMRIMTQLKTLIMVTTINVTSSFFFIAESPLKPRSSNESMLKSFDSPDWVVLEYKNMMLNSLKAI